MPKCSRLKYELNCINAIGLICKMLNFLAGVYQRNIILNVTLCAVTDPHFKQLYFFALKLSLAALNIGPEIEGSILRNTFYKIRRYEYQQNFNIE